MLTLEEFFENNDSISSIWVNCTPTPSASAACEILKEIRDRRDVVDVLIQVTMFDDPDWPYSDTVWVITTASADDVLGWFEEYIAPDECTEGWDDAPREPVDVPPAFQPVRCWWD